MNNNTGVERAIKNIKHRNGLFLCDIWSYHLNENDDIMSTIDILDSIKESLIFSGTEKTKNFEEATIPTALMNELISLVHKALVTGRSFMRDLKSGQHTYAEITAYNGSLYWAKCILLILGVWFSPKKINNHYWIIDIYPIKEKKLNSTFTFINIGPHQIGHVEVWLILKRLLRTSKNICFDENFFSFINDLEESSISYKRHHLSYHNDYWLNPEDLRRDCIKIGDISWIKEFHDEIYSTLDIQDNSPENSLIYFYLILGRNFFLLLKNIENSLPNIYKDKLSEIEHGYDSLQVFNEKNWITENSEIPKLSIEHVNLI